MAKEQQRRGSYKAKANRQSKILDMLNTSGTLSVSELSDALGTSVVTIRADLDELAAEKLITRVHGGAIKNNLSTTTKRYSERKSLHKHAKVSIAAAAAKLINDGDSVLISVGSTCSYVCEQLKNKKNIILITNALQILNEVSYSESITTFFLGGKFDESEQISAGDDVMEQLSKYKADKLIMGIDGIDESGRATSFTYTGDRILSLMIKQAREKILVADSTKIGKTAFAQIAHISDFDILITDYSETNSQILDEFRRMGVKVITV